MGLPVVRDACLAAQLPEVLLLRAGIDFRHHEQVVEGRSVGELEVAQQAVRFLDFVCPGGRSHLDVGPFRRVRQLIEGGLGPFEEPDVLPCLGSLPQLVQLRGPYRVVLSCTCTCACVIILSPSPSPSPPPPLPPPPLSLSPVKRKSDIPVALRIARATQ